MNPQPPAQPAEQGEALHTPGPWVVSPLTPCRVDTPSGGISVNWTSTDGSRNREAEANAALIARAWEIPALESRLAAAQGLIREMAEVIEENHPQGSPYFGIRALLQRAKQALEVRG